MKATSLAAFFLVFALVATTILSVALLAWHNVPSYTRTVVDVPAETHNVVVQRPLNEILAIVILLILGVVLTSSAVAAIAYAAVENW